MKKNLRTWFGYAFMTVALLGSGIYACEFASGGGGGGGGGNGSGVLYLLDNQNAQVDIFSSATNLSGSQTITQSLLGDPNNLNTNPNNYFMQNPTALAIDTARNILYVADSNQQAILAFNTASTLSGQVSALRIYPYSDASGINGRVVDLFYDSEHDILYAADQAQETVFRWAGISTLPLPNEQGPTGQIYMGFPMSSMAIDLAHNLIYLGNPSASPSPAVQMYNGLLALTNDTTQPYVASNTFTEIPSAIATLGFVNLNGMVVNPLIVTGGILYVSETGYPSIEIFNNASSLQNEVEATQEISGVDTGLVKNQLSKMILQSNTNNIWAIAGNTQVNIWQNAQQLDPLNANQAPSVSLTITGAGQIVSLALDMTR